MVAEEPFELTFIDDSGATYAQVSYFIRFGGPPDRKAVFKHLLGGFVGSTLRGTITGGVLYSDMYILTNAIHITLTCIQ